MATQNSLNSTSSTFSVTQIAGLTVNGLKPILTIKMQSFVNSGIYTPSAGLISAMVMAWGGGGGSGGAGSGLLTAGASGGAASGSYSEILLSASTIGSSQIVTIGAAGGGGAAGNNAGTSGGLTSLGSLLTAPGGGASSGGPATGGPAFSSPGVGGGLGIGDLVVDGSCGTRGIVFSGSVFCGGNGGASSIGGSARGAIVGGIGSTPLSFGSGGSGSCQSSGATAAGVAGIKGRILIIEYCNQ